MNNPRKKIKSKLENKLDELNQYKIDLGLGRLNEVIDRLSIRKKLPQIITIGGTNGKGSTVAAVCSLLETHKKSYGAFTSPHIFNFNERINIKGALASDHEILAAFEDIERAKGEIDLSYFEYAFLAAVLIFLEHQVEVMILEVGLGGRLDATNALDADGCVITTVDLDHTEWLGDTIEEIAHEKAGIMRTGVPVVFGDGKAPQAIMRQAEKTGAKLLRLNHEYQVSTHQDGFDYVCSMHEFKCLNFPRLAGHYQVKNFCSALSVLLSLGYQFTADELNRALRKWDINGRLQTVRDEPQVIADVAHNRQAAKQLARFLHDNPIAGKTRAVFSVLADKNLESWLVDLTDFFDHWFIFELKNQRAMKINDLKIVMADEVSLLSEFSAAKDAYLAALSVSNSEDRIIVFGSFHVLEEAFVDAH